VRSQGAAPGPGMESHLVVEGSSSAPPASPSVGCIAPSAARCSVVRHRHLSKCYIKYTLK